MNLRKKAIIEFEKKLGDEQSNETSNKNLIGAPYPDFITFIQYVGSYRIRRGLHRGNQDPGVILMANMLINGKEEKSFFLLFKRIGDFSQKIRDQIPGTTMRFDVFCALMGKEKSSSYNAKTRLRLGLLKYVQSQDDAVPGTSVLAGKGLLSKMDLNGFEEKDEKEALAQQVAEMLINAIPDEINVYNSAYFRPGQRCLTRSQLNEICFSLREEPDHQPLSKKHRTTVSNISFSTDKDQDMLLSDYSASSMESPDSMRASTVVPSVAVEENCSPQKKRKEHPPIRAVTLCGEICDIYRTSLNTFFFNSKKSDDQKKERSIIKVTRLLKF
ncbi:MAG: hypothetical protein ACD_45C00477G0002 [uncultured bacterium]|nr:MAG: hypothetical protein ACD_45C00477G0002 [uncultured bacterium]